MTNEELIKRLRSGIAPHEYTHERGCTILQLAARRLEEFEAEKAAREEHRATMDRFLRSDKKVHRPH